MKSFPLAVTGTGMVTGVGLSALPSCAAIRCAIDNFQETRFRDSLGKWIIGCEVPLGEPWRGRTRLIKMATSAVTECLLNNQTIVPENTPLLLCLSECKRKGRVIDDDNLFFLDLQSELDLEFNQKSRVIAQGHVSVAVAFRHARFLLQDSKINHVLVVGTDSLLVERTLSDFEVNGRLKTGNNSNGFIPGEAAAALVLEATDEKQESHLVCHGLGFGMETANVDSEDPLRADGLTAAIKDALIDAEVNEDVLEFKITDISGEQYYFKEASLAFSRVDRTKREEFDVWHPTDCVGEVGAGIGAIMIGVLKFAGEKSHGKGRRILAHLSNDDGKRAAMVLGWNRGE